LDTNPESEPATVTGPSTASAPRSHTETTTMLRHILATGPLLALVLGVVDLARAEGPQRIVSVGGALTEILYLLGVEDRLVGVDSTSQWPAAAAAFPQVGYQRSLAAEGLLSLRPDLVLVTEAAGPPAVLEQIRATGVAVRVIAAPASPAGLLEKVRALAAATGTEAVGARVADRLAAELDRGADAVAGAIRAAPFRPRVVFLLSAARGAPLAAGRDTAADALIALAGGINPLADMAGYKPLNAEALIAAAPDLLLLGTRTFDGLGGTDGVLALPGVAATPAGQVRRVVALDDLLLLGFGPRLPEAITALAAELYPDLVLPARTIRPEASAR
jgi:iron complex transport system substrate-binding protein